MGCHFLKGYPFATEGWETLRRHLMSVDAGPDALGDSEDPALFGHISSVVCVGTPKVHSDGMAILDEEEELLHELLYRHGCVKFYFTWNIQMAGLFPL